MKYLNCESLLGQKFYYNGDSIFKYFEKEYSRKILNEYASYSFQITNDDIIDLIGNLDLEEQILFLKEDNSYNVSLTNDEKCKIICKFTDDYKLQTIKNSKIYGLELNDDQITRIIKSMNNNNAIRLLAYNEELANVLSRKSIWRIIESLTQQDAFYILGLQDEQIKQFAEIYKTSFVKCFDNDEKLAVIYNKCHFDIHLDDKRKIKIVKSISKYCDLSKYLSDNILEYFDNMDFALESLITDKKTFESLNEAFKKQILAYLMQLNVEDEEIFFGFDIANYIPNSIEILGKYKSIKRTLNVLNIDMSDFLQYGCNSNKYSWYTNILTILDDENLEKFNLVKQYFFKNYYNSNCQSRYNIRDFLEILSVYKKYELFCTNLAKENKPLTNSDKEDIRFLFNSNDISEITNLKEISLIRDNKIKKYREIANTSTSICEVKDTLLYLLFDKSYDQIINILKTTGSTAELKILKFNNRRNKQIGQLVDDLILVTSLMECIVYATNIDDLKKKINYFCDDKNKEYTKRMFNYCSRYEEFNRKLYEFDLNTSLTNINDIDSELYNSSNSKELAKKYGGKIIDLSQSQYVLAAHVKSNREDLSSLLLGKSDGNSNFISLSPISHRGQVYYGSFINNDVVLAYNNIPKDSFICSSMSNLSSNSSLKYNSLEVPQINRSQRNVLETSEGRNGNNAEILLYREGLKPCGLVVPLNTIPSEEAIKIHKDYGLPFVITQEVSKQISNPALLNSVNNKEIDISEIDDIEVLKELKKTLLEFSNKDKRRIAVLADPHALYEPTLASLVDIKNKGIEEIYSLGDNVGHGPNPKEVMDLLSEYNVKSIYGNHELYLIEDKGLEEFSEHFPSEESKERTIMMNSWIKEKLSKEMIKKIRNYPERYELKLPNGNSITLIHSIEPYNSAGKYSNKPTINRGSYIIEGHEHFARNFPNGMILRAVGIGQKELDDGMATYYIIEIEGNNYKINRYDVAYDRANLLQTINESDMPNIAKPLISSWVKGKH